MRVSSAVAPTQSTHTLFVQRLTGPAGTSTAANVAIGHAVPSRAVVQGTARLVRPAVQPAYAETLVVRGELAKEVRLRHPIKVRVWIEATEFVAEAAGLGAHAFGATVAEALDNLAEAIVEQRAYLREHESELSGRLSRQLDRLDRALVVGGG